HFVIAAVGHLYLKIGHLIVARRAAGQGARQPLLHPGKIPRGEELPLDGLQLDAFTSRQRLKPNLDMSILAGSTHLADPLRFSFCNSTNCLPKHHRVFCRPTGLPSSILPRSYGVANIIPPLRVYYASSEDSCWHLD